MSISDFTLNTGDDKPEEKKEDFTEVKPEAPKSLLEDGKQEKLSDSMITVSPAQETVPTLGNAPSATPNPQDIVDGIMGKIGDIGHTGKLKVLVFGDPGCTKSSFTATAPNNLVVDLEDGLISAKNSPNGEAENVKVYPWTNFTDFSQFIGVLMKKPPELDWVETLSIDTFSELHKLALAEITEREWRKRPSTNRYVPETEHHMENNERMLRMIRALKGLNRNLIITTHAKTVEPKGKPAKTYADFSESLSGKIMAMMDVVGYMEMKVIDGKETPVMRTVSDGTINCKTRIPLPAEIINPTWDKITSAWEESKNK